METLITVVHILVALFMVLVVLVQSGNAGGVGAAFGGGNSTGLFGASGANKFLARLTYIAATIFMFTSISLTVMQSKGNKTGLMQKLEQSSAASKAAEPAAAPAASNAPAAAAPAASPEAPK